MTNLHTPAPWNTDENDIRDNAQSVIGEYGIIIADVFTQDRPGECEANAKLIAAAPELLEALESLQRELRATIKLDIKKHYSLMVAESMATKAINKAKG